MFGPAESPPSGYRIHPRDAAEGSRAIFSSEAVTRGIRIHVDPQYDPSRSNRAEGLWFYLYTVTIENQGTETVQLETRHWVITDELNQVEEVRGPGVVGEQPVLAPGESFRYTSGCPLKTATGFMHGSYQMVTEGGEAFDAEIAPFTLSEPLAVN